MRRRAAGALHGLLPGLLAGLLVVATHALALVPPEGEGDRPPPPWQVMALPDAAVPRTLFTPALLEGQRALRVQSAQSYGNLVHPLQPPLPAQGLQLAWRWRVDQPLPDADLRRRDGDDVVVKVCLGFALPIEAVPFVERQLLRLARLRTREPLPAATLCYVWDPRLPAGTALANAYTRRVRLLVLRGPEAPLAQWQAEQRDVAADFLRLFGDEATTVPPLSAVAVGADADTTQGRGLAWVQRLQLEPASTR